MAHDTVNYQSQAGGKFLQFENPRPDSSARGHWWERCSIASLWRKEDPEKNRKSLVKKNGDYRMFVTGLGEHHHKFLVDIFVTVIDLAWHYLIVILFCLYLIIFILFAIFWWLMAHNNGDFENLNNTNHEFCLIGVRSFPGAIMFSMETQSTIGYGFSYPNAHCPATVPLTYLQVIIGLFLETVMLGSIFVKIAQPKNRTNTILFSKYALINQENGQLVLQIRIGDLRKSHLVDCSISGMVIRRHTTKEGAIYPLYQFNCEFAANGMSDRMFLLYPIVVKHVIDKDSPLYDVSLDNMMTQKFEIVLYLTGTVESTGEMCQARSSYLPGEILWGYRFERIETFDSRHGHWRVNFTGFDNVVHYQIPIHSAREQDRYQEATQDHSDYTTGETEPRPLARKTVNDSTSTNEIVRVVTILREETGQSESNM